MGPSVEVQRALRFLDRPDRNAVGVDHGGLQAGVAQQFLDGADVVIGLQQVGGEGVAKGMGFDALGNFRFCDGLIQRPLKIGFVEMITTALTGFLDQYQRPLRKKPLVDMGLMKLQDVYSRRACGVRI